MHVGLTLKGHPIIIIVILCVGHEHHRRTAGVPRLVRPCRTRIPGLAVLHKHMAIASGCAIGFRTPQAFVARDGQTHCTTGRLYTRIFIGMLRRQNDAMASFILKRLHEEGGLDREHPTGGVMTGSTTLGWSWASSLF